MPDHLRTRRKTTARVLPVAYPAKLGDVPQGAAVELAHAKGRWLVTMRLRNESAGLRKLKKGSDTETRGSVLLFAFATTVTRAWWPHRESSTDVEVSDPVRQDVPQSEQVDLAFLRSRG